LGSLGFLFSGQEKVCIFIEMRKLDGDYVLGFDSSLKSETECRFLGKDLKFQKCVLDTSKTKYAKISLGPKTILDFEYLTAWFEIKKYKKLRELMIIEDFEGNIDKELILRTNKIIELL